MVVSTDYLGLGKSNYAFHPYLHSAGEASASIDAMRAVRQVLTRLNTPLSGKVMLAEYSQGGHAAIATQREIEAHFSKEFDLVASANDATVPLKNATTAIAAFKQRGSTQVSMVEMCSAIAQTTVRSNTC